MLSFCLFKLLSFLSFCLSPSPRGRWLPPPTTHVGVRGGMGLPAEEAHPAETPSHRLKILDVMRMAQDLFHYILVAIYLRPQKKK